MMLNAYLMNRLHRLSKRTITKVSPVIHNIANYLRSKVKKDIPDKNLTRKEIKDIKEKLEKDIDEVEEVVERREKGG